MTDKVAVPEGMLEAANKAWKQEPYEDKPLLAYMISMRLPRCLEAALRWLDAELEKMYDKVNQPFGCDSEAESNRLSNVRHARRCAIEDVRRMFLAPAQKVSESVAGFSDLLWDSKGDLVDMRHNDEIREAWNRAKTLYSSPDRDEPEPEVPEEIKDLMWRMNNPQDKNDDRVCEDHNINVIEAYRRGQNTQKKSAE